MRETQETITRAPETQLIGALEQDAPTALATVGTAALATLEGVWDQARYDSEIRAARRQMARGAADLAEGIVRLAIVLVRLYATGDYQRWRYATLEAYLQTEHQIGKKAANHYMRSLESLGPELMRQLLIDVGVQRTYCLAQIRDLDAEVFIELLELPAIGGIPAVAAMELEELERINAELTAALEEAYQRYTDKEDELAAARQISSTTHTRIEDVDRHNRDLVLARDRADRDRARAERELEQERKKKAQIEREAKRTVADLQRQLRELSDKLRRPLAPNAEPVTIEVIATNDPRLLASLVQLCAQGLRGTNVKALHAAAGPAQAVGTAVGELIAAGVPSILVAAVRACAMAVREVLEPGALTVDEAAAVRAALHEFGTVVAPALRAGEGNMADLDVATLRRMYLDEGMTVTAIARALRVRTQTVCTALEQWNIPRRRRGPRRVLPTLPYAQAELRSRLRVLGSGAAARHLGVAPDVIYTYLGREPLPRGTKHAVDDAAVWAAYQAGLSILEIMTQFHCAEHTIKRSLRRSFLRMMRQQRGKQ